MPCGHPFHYDCLIEWLERHNSCPTCRYTLPAERPTFDLDQERVAARDVRGTQVLILVYVPKRPVTCAKEACACACPADKRGLPQLYS